VSALLLAVPRLMLLPRWEFLGLPRIGGGTGIRPNTKSILRFADHPRLSNNPANGGAASSTRHLRHRGQDHLEWARRHGTVTHTG
jgi:hypothetical protein